MSLPYSKKVLDHFMNPRNVGELKNPDAQATEGSPACGDMIKLYLKVDKKNKKINTIKFKSYGCASNIATASIITEIAKGRTIEEAENITWKQAAEQLGGLPPVKTHCAVLAVEALKTAIENYKHQTGMIKEKKKTTIKIIKNRLRKVINPITGVDVFQVNIVNSIELGDGIVTISLDLPAKHQFAENLKEEIKERLEPLWDIKKVNIIFKKQRNINKNKRN